MFAQEHIRKVVTLFLFLIFSLSLLSQPVQLFLTPNTGTPGQSMEVVLRTDSDVFINGISKIDFGEGIILLKPMTITNSLLATVSIKIDPSATPGFRTVSINNGPETVAINSNGFEIFSYGGSNNLRATLELMPVESYNLSDLDMTNAENQPILYFVNLYNDIKPRTVKISIKITTGKYGLVGTVIKNKTTLSPNQIIRLSNRDFEKFTINKPAGSDFMDAIKEAGTLPPDEYEYNLLVEEDGLLLAEDINKTIVTNPIFNPELISPGSNFSSNPEKIYAQTPLFQWFGQANSFDFALYKVMNGQSPEEVIRNVAVFKIEELKGNNFLYPVYAEKLIDGQMYAWQINARVNTSKGLSLLPSEVFRFNYYSGSNTEDDANNVFKLLVSPQEIELKPGENYQFNAQIFNQDNLPLLNIKPEWKVVPLVGTIDQNGKFVAGNSSAVVAVIAKYGAVQDYATVTIKSSKLSIEDENGDWIIDVMMRQLFGLPSK